MTGRTTGRRAFDEETYHLVSSYVTHGPLRAPDEFDAVFDRLAAKRPRRGKKALVTYRVLRLPTPALAALADGGFRLEPRRYSSWTTDRSCVGRLRFDRRMDGQVTITAHLPGMAVVIDVEAFYREAGCTTGDFPEWSRYVLHEKEVVVREPWPEGLLVTPDMLVETGEPHDEIAPKVGDPFETSCGGEDVVEEVDAEGCRPGSGLFAVRTNGGEPVLLRREATRGVFVEVER